MAKKQVSKKKTKTQTRKKPAARSTPTAVNAASRKSSGNSTRVAGNSEPVMLSYHMIAARAYQIWERTGNCDEMTNWRDAERQLKIENGLA